jgi:HEAT repeat protein
LRAADEKAGGKLLCPECGERVDVPSASAEGKGKGKEGGAGTATLAKKSATKPAAARSNKGLLIGVGVAAFLLVGGVGVLWATGVLGGSDARKADRPVQHARSETPVTPPPPPPSLEPSPGTPAPETPVAQTPVAAAPVAAPAVPPTAPPAAATPATSKPPENQLAAGDGNRPSSPSAADLSGPEAKDIRNYLLGTTCWIVTYYVEQDGYRMSSGSGSLVDRDNRLVLTNYHVVMSHLKDRGRALAFFPMYDKGQEVVEKEKYIKLVRRNEGIAWHVVKYEPKKDLALIQLSGVPDGVKPIRIASRSPVSGDRVHSMGNPGASGSLWVYTQGSVRNVYHFEFPTGGGDPKDAFNVSAQVVETDSPTNPGDSGGPMVNNRKELIAVTQSLRPGARAISLFIDASEVREFLASYYKEKKLKPPSTLETAAEDNTSIARLIKGLEDTEPSIRRESAVRLGRFGRDATPALDALVKCARDKDETVRRYGMEAIEQIGGLSARHLPAVIEAFKDEHDDVRVAAVRSVKRMGPEAESAAAALTELVKTDKEPMVRKEAAAALGLIGPAAKVAVPVLGEALKDASAGVRAEAAVALAKQGSAAAPALQALGEGLKDSQQEVRINCLRAVEALGAQAQPLLPMVQKALKEPDHETRLAAVSAVSAVGAKDKETIGLVVNLLAEEEFRAPVGELLVKIGKPAVPVLTEALVNPKKDIRLGAVKALNQLGAESAPALPRLRQMTSVEFDAEVRKAATEAVLNINKKVSGR